MFYLNEIRHIFTRIIKRTAFVFTKMCHKRIFTDLFLPHISVWTLHSARWHRLTADSRLSCSCSNILPTLGHRRFYLCSLIKVETGNIPQHPLQLCFVFRPCFMNWPNNRVMTLSLSQSLSLFYPVCSIILTWRGSESKVKESTQNSSFHQIIVKLCWNQRHLLKF